MSTTDNIAANMKAATESLVLSFTGKWNTAASLAARAPECQHKMLPKTLGVPVKTNEQWATRFDHVKTLITEGEMTIDDYVPAPELLRAVCRSSLRASTPVGLYENEYVWFLSFTPTGDKITKIVEFIDPQATNEFRTRLREAGLMDDTGRGKDGKA